jgi:hypothetical protein
MVACKALKKIITVQRVSKSVYDQRNGVEAGYKLTAVDYDSHEANFLIRLLAIIERQCDPASPGDKNNNIRRYLALMLQLL